MTDLLRWQENGSDVAGICSVSFDYFVDWSTHKLRRVAWVKRILAELAQTESKLTIGDLSKAMEQDPAYQRLSGFCQANHLELAAFVIPDEQDWTSDLSKVFVTRSRKRDLTWLQSRSKLELPSLKAEIVALTGGPFRIGSKGLKFGTSRLECELAHTDSPWPGDVDMILTEVGTYIPRAIIELKKHTSFAEFGFAKQTLGNYYPHRDGRKYNRLSLLSRQLASTMIPLFVLYYSTVDNEVDIILERVEGNVGKLRATTRDTFRLAGCKPEELMVELVRRTVVHA